MHLTSQELATTLAALRYYQVAIIDDLPISAPIMEISNDSGEFEPLDTDEIDDLCERINTASTNCAFFKVRPTNDARSFIAWGAITPLTTEDPHSEPSEPVHYCFGPTPEIAIERLHKEMDQAYGTRQWHRQHSDTDSATKAMLRQVFKHFDDISIQSDDIIIDQMRRWRDDHEQLHRAAETFLA